MVEFALTLPLFLVLLVGVFDFGRMLVTWISLANATREMARVASFSGTSSAAVKSTFDQYLFYLGQPGTTSIVVRVGDIACALNESAGTSPCTTGTASSVTCSSLPLASDTCTIPSRSSAISGFVNVDVSSAFTLNPLFDAFLSRLSAVASTPLTFTLTTTARAYIE